MYVWKKNLNSLQIMMNGYKSLEILLWGFKNTKDVMVSSSLPMDPNGRLSILTLLGGS